MSVGTGTVKRGNRSSTRRCHDDHGNIARQSLNSEQVAPLRPTSVHGLQQQRLQSRRLEPEDGMGHQTRKTILSIQAQCSVQNASPSTMNRRETSLVSARGCTSTTLCAATMFRGKASPSVTPNGGAVFSSGHFFENRLHSDCVDRSAFLVGPTVAAQEAVYWHIHMTFRF